MPQTLTQYFPAVIPITYDYSQLGKTEADITHIKIVFKKLDKDDDTKYLTKAYSQPGQPGDDIVLDDATKTFSVTIDQGDYDTLKPSNTEYQLRLGIKFTGDDEYRDCGELTNGLFKVEPSWIKDNT